VDPHVANAPQDEKWNTKGKKTAKKPTSRKKS
jgi:hypothetical protein